MRFKPLNTVTKFARIQNLRVLDYLPFAQYKRLTRIHVYEILMPQTDVNRALKLL